MKALMAAPMEPADLSVKDLEQIFRENHALVFRAAYRITGNPNDAEDVLQTVFLRMGPIKFASRDTFLISPAGKVVKVWTGVNPSTHSDEVLAALAAEKK